MRLFIFITILVFGAVSSCSQTTQNNLTQGYKNGTLIVIGGGGEGELIMKEFLKHAGGDAAKIVVIPTALPDEYIKQDSTFLGMRKYFQKYGFEDITFLHTRDSSRANEEDFIEPLNTATGIFFIGGRQWRIADGFLHTKAHKAMFQLLDRGGVIAGSSAGATIQGSYLARGDTQNNQIMMGDHEEGLGFITNIAIDQHVLARNRQFDLFDILKKRPELLGVGIDEKTAMVVQGDTMKVIGQSFVLIYDQSFWSREGSELKNLPHKDALFYFLKSGDRYHLGERRVIEE